MSPFPATEIPSGRTALITGATDGIGLALARIYRARGARLALVGRRFIGDLDRGLFMPETYCRADLSRPDCAAEVERFLQMRGIERIDLLIQNAGTGYYGPVEDQTPAGIRNLLAVNLMTPIRLLHRLYPYLERSGGKVVLIGSVVSAIACPDYAVYAATKAAIEAFGLSLRAELKGRVSVQVIHPGATRTGLHAKIGLSRDEVDWERFPSAERVAAKIARAIEGRRPVVTIGVGNRLVRWAGRFLGSALDGAMRGARR